MSKKRNISLFCFDCDLDFTIKMNQDDVERVDMEDLHCPFCAGSVSTEDEEEEDDDGPKPVDFNENSNW